jgi:predicted transcriptional regulator
MTPAQCRAARALFQIPQPKLAQLASVGLSTVVDFERERREVGIDPIAAMQKALEAVGVQFIAENGGGEGVRVRKVTTNGGQ